MNELSDFLSTNPEPDFITFSGSGEPTLYLKFGDLAERIKEKYPDIKLCLITNSTLFYIPEVRKEASICDLVLPSLDAVLENEYENTNHPLKEITIDKIVSGLIEFRKIFDRQIWLEIFFARGVNDSGEHIKALYENIIRIKPDKIQLNTLDRPPAYKNVLPVEKKFLESVVNLWKDLPVEIISRYKNRKNIMNYSEAFEHLVLNAIKRRPYTMDDLIEIFNRKRAEISKYLDVLESEKKVKTVILDNQVFIAINPDYEEN